MSTPQLLGQDAVHQVLEECGKLRKLNRSLTEELKDARSSVKPHDSASPP